ncbi:MAG: hypothetical protein J7539_16155 [Niabella sp.]|nr:hypothetical protein [Niabella sp.]
MKNRISQIIIFLFFTFLSCNDPGFNVSDYSGTLFGTELKCKLTIAKDLIGVSNRGERLEVYKYEIVNTQNILKSIKDSTIFNVPDQQIQLIKDKSLKALRKWTLLSKPDSADSGLLGNLFPVDVSSAILDFDKHLALQQLDDPKNLYSYMIYKSETGGETVCYFLLLPNSGLLYLYISNMALK